MIHSLFFAIIPVILLFGPPGAGKGTFSQHLKENYGYNHLSIGDLLRSEVEKGTELGLQIEEKIRRGDYIDPRIVHTLLDEQVRIFQQDKTPFILDGFVQNKEDVQAMAKFFKETRLFDQTVIVYLQASDETCQYRIKNRWICRECGHVYNFELARPAIWKKCDLCGCELTQRINDQAEVTLKRLRNHRNNVEGYYKEALSLFPSIYYDANLPLQACAQFCDSFAAFAQSFPGDSISFAEEFR